MRWLREISTRTPPDFWEGQLALRCNTRLRRKGPSCGSWVCGGKRSIVDTIRVRGKEGETGRIDAIGYLRPVATSFPPYLLECEDRARRLLGAPRSVGCRDERVWRSLGHDDSYFVAARGPPRLFHLIFRRFVSTTCTEDAGKHALVCDVRHTDIKFIATSLAKTTSDRTTTTWPEN
jgi:hypothetical protein